MFIKASGRSLANLPLGLLGLSWATGHSQPLMKDVGRGPRKVHEYSHLGVTTAGPEGSRGHQGARGGAELAWASPSCYKPHKKAPGPDAQRPQCPCLCHGSPSASSCSESLVCTQNKGHFHPAPPQHRSPTRWGVFALPTARLPSREQGRTRWEGSARGKPSSPGSGPPGMGTSAEQEGREHPQGLQTTPQGLLSTWRLAGGIPRRAEAAAAGGGSRGWLTELSALARTGLQEWGWREQLRALGLSGCWEPPGR